MRTVCQCVYSNALRRSGALSPCFLVKAIWVDCIAMEFFNTADDLCCECITQGNVTEGG